MVSNIRRTLLACLQVYKQWGFGESPYATPTTYTYPLAYSVNALNVVIGSVGGRESTCRINSVSKDSFVAYRHYSGSGTGSGDLYWLAIGVQQWGYSKSCTVKFHLPFPSQVFFCGIVLDTSYGYEFGPDQLAPKDLNPSGFTKYRDDFPNFWWFAIGKQQWGLSDNMQYQTITFPISFPINCYHVTWMAISSVANAYKASGYVNSVTRNSFYATADNINCPKYWLAVGV